jgi:hypothetical protein
MLGEFAFITLLVLVQGSQPAQSGSEQVEFQVTTLRNSVTDAVSKSTAIGIAVRRTMGSAIGQEEIAKRLAPVKDKIDNPEKHRLEHLQSLLASSDPWIVRFEYTGPRGWLLDETRGATGRLRSGGDTDRRWMLYEPAGSSASSQLTIIHAGISHPVGYNVSRNLDRGLELLSLFLTSGTSLLPADLSKAVITSKNGAWSLRQQGVETDPATWDASGTIGDAGDIRVLLITKSLPSSSSSRQHRTVWAFSEHEGGDTVFRDAPRKIVVTDELQMTRDLLELTSLGQVEPSMVSANADIPSLDYEPRTLDFSREDSPAWAGMDRGGSMIWKSDGPIDAYQVNTGTDVVTQETVRPGNRESSQWSRWAAGLLATVVVAFAVIKVLSKPKGASL